MFEGLGGGLEFFLAGEVGAGDLQAVEEDGGSLVVHVSGGDAGEDVVEGDLDGVAVVDGLHFEHAEAAGEGCVGQAGAVVVVAEVVAAEGGRAAAAAVGVDVAAEIAAGWVDGVGGRVGLHACGSVAVWCFVAGLLGPPLPPYFGPKVFRGKGVVSVWSLA